MHISKTVVAHHEAAHFVVLSALNAPVALEKITINATEDHEGAVLPAEAVASEMAPAAAVKVAAGVAAGVHSGLVLGLPFVEAVRHGRVDMQTARAVLSLNCKNWRSSRAKAHDLARFTLDDKWEVVRALAFHLERCGEVTTDDALYLMSIVDKGDVDLVKEATAAMALVRAGAPVSEEIPVTLLRMAAAQPEKSRVTVIFHDL